MMNGCGKATTQTVPTQYSYKEVPSRCGSTSIHGGIVLCPECEAIERGEGIRILKMGQEVYSEPYGEAYHRTVRVKLPKHLTDKQVQEVLQGYFRRECRCAHDCCGHWNGGAGWAKRSKRREWVVRVCYAMNC